MAGRGLPASTPGDRRPSAFAAKDILEAEEFKRTTMAVLEAGGFECARVGLDQAWPERIGGHRPSLAEQLDEERRRDIEQHMVHVQRGLGTATARESIPSIPTAGRDTRSIVAELHERVSTVAAGIPEIPLPRIDGVPEDVVSQTYTKHEGARKNREACGMCANCARNEAPSRAREASGEGRGKRRKTTRRPCLTVTAVEAYENTMGYLNGADMLRIVETMQRSGSGATGRGVRCGKCRQCLGFQNQRRAKCFAVAAVGGGTVPPRLLPVVKLAAAEAEDRMLLSYPYIKQVDELRMTGVECLMNNKDGQQDRRRDRDKEEVVADDVIEAEEAARWGAPNVPWPPRTRRPRQRNESQEHDESSAVEVGKVLQSSAFGKAVAAFDEALLAAIRERQALTRSRVVAGGDRVGDGDGDEHDGGDEHEQEEEQEASDVARSAQTVRGTLYRLIEGTLNEAAIKLARKAIPTQFRNRNAGDKRIFRERTDIASFPSLPHSALDWYARLLDPSTEAATAPPAPPRNITSGQEQEDEGQACRQSIDELIELLPTDDVRLPFLAGSGLVNGGTAVRRALELFILRSRH